MATRKYDEDSIQRFAGLKGIRKKPTPYLGPTTNTIQAIPMTTKTLQEIENNGSEAYWAKQDRDANPHTEGTPESNSWYSGWDQADEENDDDDPTRLCYECDQPIEECQCEDRRR